MFSQQSLNIYLGAIAALLPIAVILTSRREKRLHHTVANTGTKLEALISDEKEARAQMNQCVEDAMEVTDIAFRRLMLKYYSVVKGRKSKLLDFNTLNEIAPELLSMIDSADDACLLSNTEKAIACLICFGFSNWEIRNYTALSENTINSRKTTIRRKMNIEKQGDIKTFFFSKFSEKAGIGY